MEKKEIYLAIKADDLKKFSSLFSDAEKLNVRLGRFPLLSVLYLFGAYQILDKYEKQLIPIRRYEELPEPYEVYAEFRKKAKKCLKFYAGADKIVEPVEMLAILDDKDTLKKNYKKFYRTDETVTILNEIYKLNHETNSSITTAEFKVKSKGLNFMEKFVMIFVCILLFVSAVLGTTTFTMIAGSTGLGTDSKPFHVRSEQELVSALAIGSSSIILDHDITLSQEISPKDFSGNFDGNGKAIQANDKVKQGLFANFSGNLKNLTLNFLIDGEEYKENFGILALSSSGTIEGVNVLGKLNITANSDYHVTHEDGEQIPTIYLSTLVAENSGTLKNCKAQVQANITNLGECNAYFSAFAGLNTGEVSDCKSLSSQNINGFDISTDTVDVAGIVSSNYGIISGCENNLSISQVTAKEWSPMVAGIVADNNGRISDCKNTETARLDCESTLDAYATQSQGEYAMYIGGIAAQNNMSITGCKNLASIVASAKNIVINAGGITAQNYYVVDTAQSLIYFGSIESSLAKCNISATCSKKDVYVGGVVAINYLGRVNLCGYEGNIKSSTTKSSCAAGISCINYFGLIFQYINQPLYSYIQRSYSSVTFDTSEILTAEDTHFGYVFSYFEVGNYNDRINFVYQDRGSLYDNHYVATGTDYGVGEVMYGEYSFEEGRTIYHYGIIEDGYDGSTQIDSLSDLPSGRRIDA